SEEAEQRALALGCAQAADLIAQLHKAVPVPLIVETRAGDAAVPQSSREAWLAGSPRRMLEAYNAAILAEARDRGALVHDVAGLADLVGKAVWHPGRFGPLARHGFAPECAPLWAERLCGLLGALAGRSRRVLVLDLDETLWGGVVGDD